MDKTSNRLNNGLTYPLEQNQALIALVDYGIGNLRSVEKALLSVGANVRLTSSAEEIQSADKIVLPGVGAFGDGILGLRKHALISPLTNAYEQGKPFLGICLGMQLFFESSDEAPRVKGLGFLQGSVRRFTDPSLKIPQTGWNQIAPVRDSPLLRELPPGSYAYFNHGYYCQPDHASDILAQTDYGVNFACAVGKNNLFGVQFHPEKSQSVGIQILRNFVELSI
jgi:glutamine amidotransferase